MRHLQYFVVAAEQGSFRKAAAQLDVQESSISRGVRDLEDEIGASLFQRWYSGVTLTEAGRTFLDGAQNVLGLLRREAHAVALVGQGKIGRVRIGVFGSLSSTFLRELIRKYQASHEQVQLEFVDGEPERHVAMVRQRMLDIAFVPGTTDWAECDTTRLWSERLFAVLPSGHKLSRRREVLWSDLLPETFLVNEVGSGRAYEQHLLRKFHELGHSVRVRLQSVERENLLLLVALGYGLCVTAEAATVMRVPGLVYRPIRNERVPFSAVWFAKNDNPALRRMLSLARRQAI